MTQQKSAKPKNGQSNIKITKEMVAAGADALTRAVDACSTLEGFAGQAEWIAEEVFSAMYSALRTRASRR